MLSIAYHGGPRPQTPTIALLLSATEQQQCIIIYCWGNKENNVFKDALGVKGLGFKHHGNHACTHGSHYGNHHGNYHDNHSNHHGSYHAEQLLFSCQFSKVSSCQVVRLSSLIVGTVLKSSMLTL